MAQILYIRPFIPQTGETLTPPIISDIDTEIPNTVVPRKLMFNLFRENRCLVKTSSCEAPLYHGTNLGTGTKI